VASEGLAERLALGAPLVVEVPLRLAVVEPEARRIAAVAGRRIAVTDQRDVAAAGQRGPGRLLVREGRAGSQKQDESAEREATDPARHRSTRSGAGPSREKR
jgi:hypothetical protein